MDKFTVIFQILMYHGKEDSKNHTHEKEDRQLNSATALSACLIVWLAHK